MELCWEYFRPLSVGSTENNFCSIFINTDIRVRTLWIENIYQYRYKILTYSKFRRTLVPVDYILF